MLSNIFWLVILTFVPTLELRWSIPIGIFSGSINTPFGVFNGFGMDPLTVFLICVIANMILGPIAYFFATRIVFVFTKIPFIKKLYDWWCSKLLKKKDFVDKYGVFAIIFFVGMPLPGSGSWGGAFSASILNIKFKDYIIGNTIGVIIAGIIIFLLTIGAFSFFGI
ncbi:MAG: small multi-drug export protein [Candidatus ainarchaeum sp.]|nr:small multi-drug export protein [Candidatus ainarchaeum sp.]